MAEATEEQTQYNALLGVSGQSGGKIRGGQRLTISARTVTKLAFPLSKIGSPSGDITMTIRKQSNDAVLASKVWADASTLAAYPANDWKEVTFDSPVEVNEEVHVAFEFGGGDAGNQVVFNFQNTDVKASEYKGYYIAGWVEDSGEDAAYRYTYDEGGPGGQGAVAALVTAGVI